MSYSFEWELNSFNELNKLPLEISKRIIDKLEQIKENPEHFIEKLKGMPEFKIREGDYRIIFLFDKAIKKLKIQAVGHRRNIYKRYKTE